MCLRITVAVKRLGMIGSCGYSRDNGVPAHQIAAFHGHDEQMTMQVYSHGEDFTGLRELMAR